MSRKEVEPPFAVTPPVKKLRFRGDLNLHHFEGSRVEDIFDDVDGLKRKSQFDQDQPTKGIYKSFAVIYCQFLIKTIFTYFLDKTTGESNEAKSFFDFLKIEITRGYVLEHDEERYSARRQKIYTFMTIPRELEKFMVYGVLQCVDSFLYIHTFLPIRYLMALWAITWRPLATCFGWRRRGQRILSPAEICDLLKGSIWIIATLIILSVDTNRMYHIIKSQSVIKLYIFYNMLEVGDRLLSAFGQDTIDALFWTATEPKDRSRAHLGVIAHIVFALTYIVLHSGLIMLQATALNVAINSNNKGLLAIMMSNNFVELKGSVFKKFDKNNLFQLTCSDVRERVHLTVLLFVVVIQTMKEFNWKSEQFYVLLPDCCYVLIVEVFIDWLKHAFITRFNELPADVYKEYTISLAYDMTQTRQKHAFSDHSDLVSRRMGFIPYPLGIVLIKALYTAISFDSFAAVALFAVAYVMLLTCRILNTICTLGKACDLMQKHQDDKQNANNAAANPFSSHTINGVSILGATPAKPRSVYNTMDASSSPMHTFVPLQRSKTADIAASPETKDSAKDSAKKTMLLTDPNLGATALFSNSDVDLDDICLNEKLLNVTSDDVFEEPALTRSVPDLQQQDNAADMHGGGASEANGSGGGGGGGGGSASGSEVNVHYRTHKRSESEPSIQSAHILDSAAGTTDRS